MGNISFLNKGKKMKKGTSMPLFIFSVLVFVLSNTGLASAEFSGYADELRNPFKSWLPKIEEIIEKLPEPTKIEVTQPEPVAKPHVPVIQPPQEQIAEPVQAPPELTINGVVWGTERPQAIINNQVVSIGDTIENSKIVDIHPDGVDVIFSNKLFTIKIEQVLTQAI